MMARILHNRAVLISGGGSGLGRAIACRLAAGGAAAVVADIDEAGAAQTVRTIEAAGGEAAAVRLDVTDPVSARSAVHEAYEQFGDRFDGLVNNAGTDRGAGILDLTDEQWQQVIAGNQSGPLYLSRA